MSKYSLKGYSAALVLAGAQAASLANPAAGQPASAPSTAATVRDQAGRVAREATNTVRETVGLSTIKVGVVPADGSFPTELTKPETAVLVRTQQAADALNGPLQAFMQSAVRRAQPNSRATIWENGEGVGGMVTNIGQMAGQIFGGKAPGLFGVEYQSPMKLQATPPGCVTIPFSIHQGQLGPDGRTPVINSQAAAEGVMHVCRPGTEPPGQKPQGGPSVLDLLRGNTGTPKPQ